MEHSSKIIVESDHSVLCPTSALQLPKKTGSESPAFLSPPTFHVGSVPTQSIFIVLQNLLGFLSSLSLSSLSAIALSSFESPMYLEPVWPVGFVVAFCCSFIWFCLASKAATRLWQGWKKSHDNWEQGFKLWAMKTSSVDPNRLHENYQSKTETTPPVPPFHTWAQWGTPKRRGNLTSKDWHTWRCFQGDKEHFSTSFLFPSQPQSQR